MPVTPAFGDGQVSVVMHPVNTIEPERMACQGCIHPVAAVRVALVPWTFALLALLLLLAPVSAVLFAVGGGSAIIALLLLRQQELIVTTHRLRGAVGLLTRRSVDLPLDAIESVSVAQDVIGRMFGYGTVKISGRGNTSASFRGITSPEGVRQTLHQVMASRQVGV
jgi:uncharacterized membrane protein YdbT with pleckstrin-like domain